MKKEPLLFRIAVLLVGIATGIGSLKLGIPQAIARMGIDYISDGMNEVTERQREKLEQR